MNPILAKTLRLVRTLWLVVTQGCIRKRRGYSLTQIQQMPQFTGTVTDIKILDYAEFHEHPKSGERFIVIVGLKTPDSREFCIMQTHATSNHAAFARQLSIGRNYTFPQIIPDFEDDSSQ